MAYSKQTWANTSGGGTPLNETRLNHMEDGIDQAYKGQYLIDQATPYDPGMGTDEFIVYRDGATPSTGKVTLDAIKAYMLANGLSSLTLEQVQDSVSGMLVAGTAITLTYNDGADTLTIDAATPPTDEQVQDIVAAMLVAGTDISVTYNDGAGTATVAYTGSGGGGSAYENRIDDPTVFATMYGTIDTGSSTECDGTALSIPSPSGAAWINQGGRTFLEDDNIARIKSTSSVSTSSGSILWSKPASNFTVYAKIQPSIPVSYNGAGIVFANSADAQVFWGPMYSPGARVMTLTAGGGFGGDLASLDTQVAGMKYFCLSYVLSTTTLIASVSNNGECFTPIYTNTGYSLPGGFDRIGICQYSASSGLTSWAIFEWFRVVL